jgi:putative two-component system response regulator
VLVVDDEPAVRDLVARWTASLGLRVHTAGSADEALATLRAVQVDLAVIDVMMPGHDGFWLADRLQRDHPHTALVMATAHSETLVRGERPPSIADFLIKPFHRERFVQAVDRGRQWRRQTLEELQWHAQLSLEVQDRMHEICSRLQCDELDDAQEMEILARFMYERVPIAAAHGERVARYAESVARQMGVEQDEPSALRLEIAARFHDLGKAVMPDALLGKPSPLTAGEMAIMRRHVSAGAGILGATTSLQSAAPVVMASHEWFEGGGYPHGIGGEAIPLAGRIVAVVDAYDAMTHAPAYRGLRDSADAVGELLRCAPAQFDPAVVAGFLAVLGRH